MVFYVILGAGIVGALIHGGLRKGSLARGKFLELLLAYLFFTWVGCNALLAFFGHIFEGPMIAEKIGWPPGSPFQLEIGFANLSYGILGVLAFWIRGKFWLAVLVGYTVLLWGAAGVHIWDLQVHHNTSPYNAGIMLYLDLFIPLVLWVLYLVYRFRRGRGNSVT